MVSWLEVFLMILFVVSLADTRPTEASPALISQAEGERKANSTSGGAAMGHVATLEAAKRAFRAAWDRRSKASGES